MNPIKKFTVGSDPEGWIRSKETGQMIPIIGLLGGTKDCPIEFAPGYGLQEDNCSWEFNIPPANSKKELIDFMHVGIQEVTNVLEQFEIVIKGSAEFHEDFLKKPEAVIIGCSVDFNAYSKDLDKVPDLTKTNRRFAGGHIHIGYDSPVWTNQVLLVKYLDLFLNAPAILLDDDQYRKPIYGNPGRFRQKEYGIEYRSLSNFWIQNENLISFVWDQIEKAIDTFNRFGDAILESEGRIFTACSSNDPELAMEIIKEFDVCSLDRIKELTLQNQEEHARSNIAG
jgi:hypothetical protein